MPFAEAVIVVAGKGILIAEERHLLLAKFAFHESSPPKVCVSIPA